MVDISFFQVIILGAIQGLTEFLPISSSAHLQLPRVLLGWEDQGLTFDVALHLGSLLAVLIYLKDDIANIVKAVFTRIISKKNSTDADLAFSLMIATVPGAVIGFLLNNFVDQYTRSIEILAVFTFIFALVLLYADNKGSRDRSLKQLTWRDASYIGFAQVIALIPGVSRSGVTMSAALLLGYNRKSAAKFSFFLSIPIILGSNILRSYDLYSLQLDSLDFRVLLYGMIVSGLVAYSCIHYFLALVERFGFLPFVVYRIFLSITLILISLI